jgi:hypothetical protein
LFWPSTQLIMALLARRGYHIAGSFSCRGAYDWGSLPLPAGNVGHPDATELDAARRRAAGWRTRGRPWMVPGTPTWVKHGEQHFV